MDKRKVTLEALDRARHLVARDRGPSYERLSQHHVVVGESDSHRRERQNHLYHLETLEKVVQNAFLQDGQLDSGTQGDLIALLELTCD